MDVGVLMEHDQKTDKHMSFAALTQKEQITTMTQANAFVTDLIEVKKNHVNVIHLGAESFGTVLETAAPLQQEEVPMFTSFAELTISAVQKFDVVDESEQIMPLAVKPKTVFQRIQGLFCYVKGQNDELVENYIATVGSEDTRFLKVPPNTPQLLSKRFHEDAF